MKALDDTLVLVDINLRTFFETISHQYNEEIVSLTCCLTRLYNRLLVSFINSVSLLPPALYESLAGTCWPYFLAVYAHGLTARSGLPSITSRDYALPWLLVQFSDRVFSHARPSTWVALAQPDNVR